MPGAEPVMSMRSTTLVPRKGHDWGHEKSHAAFREAEISAAQAASIIAADSLVYRAASLAGSSRGFGFPVRAGPG